MTRYVLFGKCEEHFSGEDDVSFVAWNVGRFVVGRGFV